MKSRLSRLWREPLLHFLLIGFALFLYYDMAGDNTEAPPKLIHIDRGQVQLLAKGFERTWSRPPQPAELEAMIENHVREEVFYREALALGLDQDDPLVKRRMRMKLEFLLEDLSAQDYDDAILDEYRLKNADRFRQDARLSFRQVYLNPEKRSDLDNDANNLLAQLEAGADPGLLGDATLARREFELARTGEIARDFGEDFAAELAQLAPGNWVGPVYSPFGAHLVRVEERIDSSLPPLAEIRDRVLRVYQTEQRQLQKDVAYEKLREGYEVTIESTSENEDPSQATTENTQ